MWVHKGSPLECLFTLLLLLLVILATVALIGPEAAFLCLIPSMKGLRGMGLSEGLTHTHLLAQVANQVKPALKLA